MTMAEDINYSTLLLQCEFDDRAPIRSRLRDVVLKRVPDGGRIVELGSGLGFNLDELSKRYQVLGVEGLGDAAARASRRGIETIQANLEHGTGLETASFDAVLCLDVLEHLMDPASCIREAHRLLRSSGIFIVNVPNHFLLSYRIRMLFGEGLDAPRFFPTHDAWNYPHVRFFKSQSIQLALTSNGFSVDEDLSSDFSAVPILRKIRLLRGLCRFLGRSWPDLFCGGFFLVLRKD